MKYFANDWDHIASIPPEAFASPPVEAVLAQASSWTLPDEFRCVIRSQHPSTLKVTEKVFKTEKRASAYRDKQEDAGFIVTAYTDSTLYYSPGFQTIGDSYQD